MIHEKSFSLSELTLDQHYLSSVLGFPDGVLPEPFDQYVAEAIEEAESLCTIRGAFCFPGRSEFATNNSHITIDGIEFGIGKTVAKELRDASSVALFVCTAGRGISHSAQELLKGEDPVKGYVLDLLGSMIVEAACDQLQDQIKQIAHSEGLLITNRYSPGYCKWSVGDQHKLFSFFPPNCCGISLTDSSLMHPIKSVSGIIGLGKAVKFREYTCDLCSQVDCFHKNHVRPRK
jgi:hypothetical protein